MKLDWTGLLEELAQRVLEAEREGEPDELLNEGPPSEPAAILDVAGLKLPARHPSILFGDGDSGKSMLLLWVLGNLRQRGLKVGLADWELTADDHRQRLREMFPENTPDVRYLRCARPIVHEADRLRRWVRDR